VKTEKNVTKGRIWFISLQKRKSITFYVKTNRLHFVKFENHIKSDINVKKFLTPKRWRTWRKFVFSVPHELPNNVLKYCTRPLITLQIPMYRKNIPSPSSELKLWNISIYSKSTRQETNIQKTDVFTTVRTSITNVIFTPKWFIFLN
jgi:hypothetical protein